MLLTRTVSRKLASARVQAARGFAVLTWGNGNEGQLGLGEVVLTGMGPMASYDETAPTPLETIPLDEGESVVDWAGGADHTLVTTSSGKVWAWGNNKHGKLGGPLGAAAAGATTPVRVGGDLEGAHVTQVAAGDMHSCAVDSEGRLYTWGFGGSFWSGGGLLGHGTSDSVEGGPKLVESLVAEGVKVKTATAGELHTAVLTQDGEVLTCGVGEYGRLGLGGSNDEAILTPIEWLEDETVEALVSGHAFSMALTKAGKLWVWGRNDAGQLGQGGTMSLDVYSMQADPVTIEEFEAPDFPPIAHISAGFSHAALVTDKGDLYMWGMKNYLSPKKFEVVDPETGRAEAVAEAACGNGFTAVRTPEGRVYTFGNKSSALGHGVKQRQPQPTLVEGLKGVTALRAGQRHVAAFTK